MTTDLVLDVLAGICLILGCLMSLTAAVGLLRFPDLMSRMHAATKPQVLGLLLMLAAVGIQSRSWILVPLLAAAWIFQALTAPVSAHMVGRAGYRTRHLRKDTLSGDDLDDVVARAAAGAPGTEPSGTGSSSAETTRSESFSAETSGSEAGGR